MLCCKRCNMQRIYEEENENVMPSNQKIFSNMLFAVSLFSGIYFAVSRFSGSFFCGFTVSATPITHPL